MKRGVISVFGIAIVFGILLSYPISAASGVMIFLAGEFDMNAITKSLLVCLVILGAMVGVIGGGPIADRYGRKKAIFFAAVFLFIGSLFSTMAKHFNELLIFRFAVGIGIGITSMIVPVYLAEIALPKYRGKMVSIFQVAITLGILISYITNLCLFDTQSWRIALGVSAFFSILAFVFLFYIPESPSWLISKGDVEGGRELLIRLYPRPEADEIIDKIVSSKSSRKRIRFRKLFQGGLKKALIIGVLLSVFQQITGINAIIYYAPEIFHHAGITGLCHKLIATTFLGVLNVCTALFALTQIDNWGRRNLLLIGIPGMIGALIILALFFNIASIAVLGLVLYIIFFGISLGPVAWVFIAEIYPLEIRGKAVSIALFMNWLASLFVVWPFLFCIEKVGISAAFSAFALMSLFALFFIYFFVPETKGKTLEEIQQYWQK